MWLVINDNGREYDINKLDSYSSMTQGIVRRLIYSRYVAIRNLLSDSCCNKLKASRVKEMINDKASVERIKNIFSFTDEEITFYIDYTIQNFPMVK